MDRIRIVRESECTPEKLPAAAIAGETERLLNENPVLVVTAPPGAGKSTLLPITIYNGTGCRGKVLVLEPRRIAARQIAERMAWLVGEQVGQTIGYRMRFESKVSCNTKIEVITEGILTRMLVNDPTLDGVAAVIFDEFHERSLSSDLALALTRESFSILRPDLRIVIMSATIDVSSICKSLGANFAECGGRVFPVEIIHSDKDTDLASCVMDVARHIRLAHERHEGDILAFLPGEGEIRKCASLLENALGETSVLPLYGMLSSAEQSRAIAPCRPGKRKVVLATPVAETSVTIEGVRIVIDCGLCRKMIYDSQSGLDRLETVRISMDMAMQRAGRAGRTAPGICYRLWTEGTERRMAPSRIPEILEADLCSALLDITAWGGEKAESLPWLSPPPEEHIESARKLLRDIDAIDGSGSITTHGRKLSSLPCHPRISNMLVRAENPKLQALAADIAAILEEKDPLAASEAGSDMSLRIEALRRERSRKSSSRSWGRLTRISAQYRELVKAAEDNYIVNPFDVGKLLAAAYPERIGQNRGYGHFLLSGGNPAMTELSDSLASCDYIAVASMNMRQGAEGKIFLAAPLSVDDVKASSREVLGWDAKAGRVIARTERRIGRILIGSQPLTEISKDDIVSAVCQAAPKHGLSMFDFSDNVQNLQRRIAAVSSWHPELELPDVSTETILAKAGEWLPLYIGKASTEAELKKIDMEQVIWNMLEYGQQSSVNRLAPSHIDVPTGSHIRVEYRHGADAPVLRVRLQECFGMSDTPKVDDGKRTVLMELLSPGFKPVQLTSDLKSFWSGTYHEVRKELRMRYPKHSWPENPFEAQPVRGVVRKK